MNKSGLIKLIAVLTTIFIIVMIGTCQQNKNAEAVASAGGNPSPAPAVEEKPQAPRVIPPGSDYAPINMIDRGKKKVKVEVEEKVVQTTETITNTRFASPLPGWEVVYFGTEPPASTLWPAAEPHKTGTPPVMRIRLVQTDNTTPIKIGAGLGGITWKISGPYDIMIRKSNTEGLFLIRREEAVIGSKELTKRQYFKLGKEGKYEPYQLTESYEQFIADMEWIQFTPKKTRSGIYGDVEVQFTTPRGFKPKEEAVVVTPPTPAPTVQNVETTTTATETKTRGLITPAVEAPASPADNTLYLQPLPPPTVDVPPPPIIRPFGGAKK